MQNQSRATVRDGYREFEEVVANKNFDITRYSGEVFEISPLSTMGRLSNRRYAIFFIIGFPYSDPEGLKGKRDKYDAAA